MSEGRLNPYNVGGIAGDGQGQGFFGREDILGFVREQLASVRRAPILLQGQRRIGKSSVLRQIPRVLGAEQRCAVIDLQGKAKRPLAELLYAVAREVALACAQTRPDPDGIDEDSFEPWLREATAHIGGLRRLVLLFDEFDVVDGAEQGAEGGRFVSWLSAFTERLPEVGCVMVVGRKASELSEQIAGAMLRNAVHRRIGRLARPDSQALVLGLAGAAVAFDEAALEAIWHHAAGHPYCTQVLCSELWNMFVGRAAELPVAVSAEQVQAALLPAIESGTLGLNWIYDGLTVPSHRFFLGAMAELDGAAPAGPLSMASIEQHLFKRGTAVDAAELRQAPVKLANWDVIESGERGHAFSVPMIGLWIRRNRPLADLASQSQLLNPRAFRYYELAADNARREAWDEAIADYQQALQANPALVEAHLGLATALRARHGVGDLAAAIEAYERALDLDPATPKTAMLDTLVEAIEAQGANVAEQLRLYGRVQALDEGGQFRERARRLLNRFALLRIKSLQTVSGAADLFDALGDANYAQQARRREEQAKRLDSAFNLCLFGGIAAGALPLATMAGWIGWSLSEPVSDWVRALSMSLVLGLSALALEAKNGYAAWRLSVIPVVALAIGWAAQWYLGSLWATGFCAFFGASVATAWSDNSRPIPAELRAAKEDGDAKRPLADLARQASAWLARYAQPTKRKDSA